MGLVAKPEMLTVHALLDETISYNILLQAGPSHPIFKAPSPNYCAGVRILRSELQFTGKEPSVTQHRSLMQPTTWVKFFHEMSKT